MLGSGGGTFVLGSDGGGTTAAVASEDSRMEDGCRVACDSITLVGG